MSLRSLVHSIGRAHVYGPIFICRGYCRWMDEPPSAGGYLISDRGESGRSRTAGYPCRTPGRQPTRKEIAALAVRMAEANRSWGYRRIQGALANLGHDLAHNTIRNILKRHGIEPSPERARKTTWKEFLQRHWQQIVASDFFTMDASKVSRLASLVVLCFMKVSTHGLDIAKAAGQRDGLPMTQIVGKVTQDRQGLYDRK